MKICFYTLGCKVNQYETQAMSENLRAQGYEITEDREKADIFIVNSCTVTATADKKTRQAVRKFKRSRPDSIVILTGCMPQAYPKDAQSLVEADIVIGNRNNDSIVAAIDEYMKNGKRLFDVTKHMNGESFSGGDITTFDDRTRAIIKIQDGCNRFCTYCIIPTSRGRVRSKPLEELKAELNAVSERGFSEVVLVGINLSSYGSDIGLNFPDAVEAACAAPGIKRVRLGSLEPDHLTEDVIKRLAECEKLCPQFHISLQSGCNKTLKDMHRHYTAEEYRELCDNLRKTFRDCTLTTDVMVGFPMETDEDFNESLDFVKSIRFEKVHVFPYSLRPGTKAASFSPQIEKKVKEERSRKMIEETEKIRREFMSAQIGKTVSVLFESKSSDGFISGYTENYLPVEVRYDGEDLCGKIRSVKITALAGDDHCKGELI
ncbi:MAG: tRNA (N(6)-L-threonylcarbamoyladenosine(37)-C(2))-methylthiotransferase MtaB [Oscillospiraceae bacterium]|nr:tRNA (N(6)-L-threonylcarbamoyladenosine(37)-C(2))-methylthiotransferase MtaB [Oscillospiraceae bacterium]